jgi:hypothetical protein
MGGDGRGDKRCLRGMRGVNCSSNEQKGKTGLKETN